MANKFFYKLNLWEKSLICIGAFFAVLGGLKNYFYWLNEILKMYFPNPTIWTKIIFGVIFIISGLAFTYIILYANSIFPYIKQLIFKLKKGDSEIVIPLKDYDNLIEGNNEYKRELGEIAAYWGNRNAANVRIKDLLKSTSANELFIAAIGFSTIKVLDDTEVIGHFADLINSSKTLIITIVFPQNIKQLKSARPEIPEHVLTQKFNDGQLLLKNFKSKLLDKLINKEKIDKCVKFHYYNDHTIPRHFILQDNNTIFYGSYLSSETGNNSYLIELCNNTRENHKNELTGLYNLFIKEIDNIKSNSIKTNF
ncbi:MAG: hypothetical protein SCALA702_01080 [Melioribacteraceae bacterium]|nr:MAG: hypothetical protein SCALA702_01080 [Melioribacteraceae bacterium]